MITKEVGNLVLKLYSGVDDLPSENYHRFNFFALMSAGIGSDTSSVMEHITNMHEAANRKDFERIKVLLQNYHHALHLINNGEDLESNAFICLIHSINNEELTDLTDENIKKVRKRISRGQNRAMIINLYHELKKKLKAR